MVGSATFTMVRSIMSIRAPTMRTAAASQRVRWPGGWAAAAATALGPAAVRRRREPISRDAIVDAALALLDRDGFEALSMRALAEALGTGAASLYWHVSSKDGLLDLVFEKVIGEVGVP